jgi:N-acetyl-anhydromuramoyl-L-alanine amidase
MPHSPLSVAADGWVAGVDRLRSPNADARPPDARVSLVVIHNISLPPGCFGGGFVERLFLNQLDAGTDGFLARVAVARVSAHFYIDRSGRCVQFVSCLDRAWHAGASSFRGRQRCNDFSVGIELEGSDFEPYADAQYVAINALLPALAAAYPLEAIVGHSDIATDRKTDPGPFFDWGRLSVSPELIAR